MANVEWASVFFQKVTSRLPDLLTEKGEGKELEALDQLRSELGAADKEAKQARAVELQAELDALNGKPQAPPPAPPTDPSEPVVSGVAAAESKPSRNR